jgi:cell division protein FtsI/penicillin-binding protein 2
VGLSGLQQAYQRTLVGTPTTEVVEENASGHVVSVLKSWSGRGGTNVSTTIDARVQDAADNAVDSAPASAAIVAVSASSGRVLAVASNQAAGTPAVDPLNGRYPPGQAFTMVSAEALLSGGFKPDTPIPCIASNEVGGEDFTNDPPEPDLGPQPPFSTDFADACGTAFAGLSLQLSAKSLDGAASGFGLGAEWQLPLSSFAGSMQPPADQAELAEDSIGSGSVQVSPLGMALAAAVVESGAWHAPSLVTSPPDPGQTPRAVFGAQTVSALRTLMRSTVTSGAGQAANVAGTPVYGQVGSAPMATGGLRAAWFVGYQGNVAFAVLELSNSATASAAPLTGQFLSQLQAGT